MELDKAMLQLSLSDDSHWTKEGLPNLNVLKEMTGQKHTRGDAEAAIPGFTREYVESTYALIDSEGLVVMRLKNAPQSEDEAVDEEAKVGAITLLNKFVNECGDEQYRRNSGLQQIKQHVLNSMPAILEHQGRIDLRNKQRAEEEAKAKKKGKK